MADIYNQVIFNWVDANGKTGRNFLTTQDQDAGGASGYASLAAAAQACCDAALVAVQFQTTLVIASAPASGAYGTVWDRAVFGGRNSITNAYQKNALVGPKTTIFLPDTITVDLTNSDVIAFQTELQAVIGDQLGNPAGPFLKGWRDKASGG